MTPLTAVTVSDCDAVCGTSDACACEWNLTSNIVPVASSQTSSLLRLERERRTCQTAFPQTKGVSAVYRPTDGQARRGWVRPGAWALSQTLAVVCQPGTAITSVTKRSAAETAPRAPSKHPESHTPPRRPPARAWCLLAWGARPVCIFCTPLYRQLSHGNLRGNSSWDAFTHSGNSLMAIIVSTLARQCLFGRPHQL